MKLIDAANEIMEELEWTARTAARGERLTTAQRTAIRLALAFGEGRACAELVELVRGIGVLAMLGEFELRPAKDNPSEFGRLGPHGIVMGIRTGAGRRVVQEGGDAHAVGARLYEGWAREAESLGEQLVQLSHPGIAAVRKLARVSNRANHLWTA